MTIGSVVRLVDFLFWCLELLIIARVIIPILSRGTDNKNFAKFRVIVVRLTEPMLLPIRNLLKKLGFKTGMVDFSPLILLLLINILFRRVAYLILLG